MNIEDEYRELIKHSAILEVENHELKAELEAKNKHIENLEAYNRTH